MTDNNYLRVMVYLNPSVFNKLSHKFDYNKDSGFLMVKNSILAINKIRKYHFYLIVPSKDVWDDAPANVTLIEYPYINDALNSRYHFDVVTLHKQLSVYSHDIDLVWTMLPENVGNFKAWLLKRRESAPIFTYCNWMNYSTSSAWPSYQYRMLEGLMDCTAFGIQSEHMKYYMLDYLINKTEIISAEKIPYDKIHIISPKTTEINWEYVPSAESKIIGFPHRISKESYFYKMMGLINPELGEYKIWVTNLLGVRNVQSDNIIDKSYEDWNEYIEELRKIKFGISYHIGYSMWSMSVLDMMAVGKVVLAPNKNAFPEMFPEGYPFLFNDKQDFLNKFNQLKNASEEELEFWGKKNQEQVRQKFTWDVQANQLVSLWESLIAHKTHDMTKSIFELLKQYNALSKHGILKDNILQGCNGFISLAWNSIRRELIQDYGVHDDVNSKETIFYLDAEKYAEEGLTKAPKDLIPNPWAKKRRNEE